jgi:hypothetical protein
VRGKERAYEEPMSPKKAFSLATRGGWKDDWALAKYCIGAIVAVWWKETVR